MAAKTDLVVYDTDIHTLPLKNPSGHEAHSRIHPARLHQLKREAASVYGYTVLILAANVDLTLGDKVLATRVGLHWDWDRIFASVLSR